MGASTFAPHSFNHAARCAMHTMTGRLYFVWQDMGGGHLKEKRDGHMLHWLALGDANFLFPLHLGGSCNKHFWRKMGPSPVSLLKAWRVSKTVSFCSVLQASWQFRDQAVLVLETNPFLP